MASRRRDVNRIVTPSAELVRCSTAGKRRVSIGEHSPRANPHPAAAGSAGTSSPPKRRDGDENTACSINYQPPVRRSSRGVGGSTITRDVSSMKVLRSRYSQCDPDLALLVAGGAAVPAKYGRCSQIEVRCSRIRRSIKTSPVRAQ